eukprot:6209052-Pleurochrysis_carterae.AAC.2
MNISRKRNVKEPVIARDTSQQMLDMKYPGPVPDPDSRTSSTGCSVQVQTSFWPTRDRRNNEQEGVRHACDSTEHAPACSRSADVFSTSCMKYVYVCPILQSKFATVVAASQIMAFKAPAAHSAPCGDTA